VSKIKIEHNICRRSTFKIQKIGNNQHSFQLHSISFLAEWKQFIFISAQLPRSQRHSIKVILVGNSGVGKTCLIASFYKQSFDFKMNASVAPACSFSNIRNSHGVNVRLQIWDTAGQEKYLAVNQLFFRDADVALVCFEADDHTSIDAIGSWVDRVKVEVPACELLFVMTKSDLKTSEEIEKIKKTVEPIISQYNPKTIYITSALTRQGVNEVFCAAADTFKPKALSRTAPGTNIADTKKKSNDGCC
jgi:small GTP-binding protein